MFLCSSLVIALCICISSTVGHHLEKQIYQQMCDGSEDFRKEMGGCLSQMPEKDQRIFQLCGSATTDDVLEDYDDIMDELCQDVVFASKVVHCIEHISHIFHHFNDTHDHGDHHRPGNHHHHHHHHQHHDHHQEEDHDHDEDPPEADHKDHDHHDHHHHYHGFGHGVYNEECFQRLYKMFNITSEVDEA